MTLISVNLENSLKDKIEEKAGQLEITTNELVVQAIKDFLYTNRVDALRAQLQPQFNAQGYENEEDLFKSIS